MPKGAKCSHSGCQREPNVAILGAKCSQNCPYLVPKLAKFGAKFSHSGTKFSHSGTRKPVPVYVHGRGTHTAPCPCTVLPLGARTPVPGTSLARCHRHGWPSTRQKTARGAGMPFVANVPVHLPMGPEIGHFLTFFYLSGPPKERRGDRPNPPF